MRTFASRTSEPNFSLRRRRSAAGFTLLEILVVMVIVGILTGTVIFSFTGADSEQRLKGTAQNLAARIELARQHALQRNREWGIYVERDGYRFAEFDVETAQWVEREGRTFGATQVPEEMELRLKTSGVGELPFADGEDLPQIVVFSSGEITPFTVFVEPDWNTEPWQVTSDGISRTTASREGDRALSGSERALSGSKRALSGSAKRALSGSKRALSG
jgi:general secretion pathway protein H